MTDGTVTRYKNRFGNSYFTGHQSGITISLTDLNYYRFLIRWTFPQFSGQTRCISIQYRRWFVNNCWVGGSLAWCGCKRGELIPSSFQPNMLNEMERASFLQFRQRSWKYLSKSQRTNQYHSLRTLNWFVLCNLQTFSGCVCHLEQLHTQSAFPFPIVLVLIWLLFPILAQYSLSFVGVCSPLLGPLRGRTCRCLWLCH